MELTENQYQRIADCLPRQRGNVSLNNLTLLNALLYMVENGCKWRRLPPQFGNWHTIYTRMNRWSKAGVLDRIFARLQAEQILAIRIEQVCLDSTTIKFIPTAPGLRKKRPASHRPIPGRKHHQDSSGCRECSVRPDAQIIPRAGRGCSAGAGVAGGWGVGANRLLFDNGCRLSRG